MHIEDIIHKLDRIDQIERTLNKICQHLSSGKSEDILDIDAAAQFTGLSKSTLYSMTSKRTIPHMKRKDLNKIFFSKAKLETWLKEGEKE